MRDAAFALLAVLLVLLTVGVPAAATSVGGSDHGTAPRTAVGSQPAAATTPVGESRVPAADSRTGVANSQQTGFSVVEERFLIDVDRQGDARWNVTVSYRLTDDADRAAFEAFADRYETNETTLGPSVTVWRGAARTAEREAGREMVITNVAREAETGERVGRLSLLFTWESFANRTGAEQFRINDAFAGSWFPALTDDQTLVIRLPPDSGVIGSRPLSPLNGSFIVNGPRGIGTDVVDITYRLDVTPTPTPTASPTPPPEGGLPTEAVGIGALLVALAAMVYLVATGDGFGLGASRTDDDDDPPAPPESESEPEPEPESEPEPTVDPELLSDEERVERLLTENGGRMRQADIVDETGWSDAKVSQLLSAMAEEDRIDKLRIGRENLISLPDENAADFDDEPQP